MTGKEPNFSHSNVASSSKTCSHDESIWKNLTSWVQQKHDGHVHEALHLETTHENHRGVISSRPIAQGELLIRIPSSCVLSGRTVLQNPDYEKSLRQKSSWMQCVSAYYHACSTKENDDKWKPYLDSLPQTYETVFQWSDDEIKTYLRGTTLGAMILADRSEDSMKTRYHKAVRPVLDELKLLGEATKTEEDEMKTFLDACMCISTRGFHYSSGDTTLAAQHPEESSTPTSSSEYKGPFLLPIIDLLNHNPSKACTTLQYTSKETGCFSMVAERPIAQGEEIFHSYGDSMTSAQLLQTFGFVMEVSQSTTAEATTSTTTIATSNTTISTTTNSKTTTRATRAKCLTPASLSKSKHLIPACHAIRQSGIPKRLQSKLAALAVAQRSINEEMEETWEVKDLPIRDKDGILSEDVLIDCNSHHQDDQDESDDDHKNKNSNNNNKGLTDELITWMCLQFLPKEAYEEMCEDDGKVSALFDAFILQDLYLGILVCRSLLLALDKKLDEYDCDLETTITATATPTATATTTTATATATPTATATTTATTTTTTTTKDQKTKSSCVCETTNGVVDRLEALLLVLLMQQPPPSVGSSSNHHHHHRHRAQYGWTVRTEELSNLKVWAMQVSCIMKCLYEEINGGGDTNSVSIAKGPEEQPNAKRAKVEAE